MYFCDECELQVIRAAWQNFKHDIDDASLALEKWEKVSEDPFPKFLIHFKAIGPVRLQRKDGDGITTCLNCGKPLKVPAAQT